MVKTGLELTSKILEKKKFYFFTLLILILFAFAYRKLLSSGMIYFGDVIPFPYKPSGILNDFLYIWSSSYMGTERQSLPLFYIVIAGFLAVFRDPVIAQKIYYFLPLPIAAISMYLFLGRFIQVEAAKYIGALIYAINPIASYGGPPGPMIFPYALYPLMFLFLLRMLEEKKYWPDLTLFTLLTGLAMVFSFYSFLIFLPVVLFSLAVMVVANRKWAYLGATITKLNLFLVGSILLALPSFIAVLMPSSAGTVIGDPSGFIQDIKATYWDADPLRLLRLTGNTGATRWFFGYKGFQFWTLTGYLIPALAISSFFLVKDWRRKYIYIFLLIALFVILQAWLTKEGLTQRLFLEIPPLFALRNPKLLVLLPLVFSPLVAMSTEQLLFRIRRFKIDLLIFLFGALAIYNWPFFTGDMGTGYILQQFQAKMELSSIEQDVAKWIQDRRKSEGFFRTLWLPFNADSQSGLRWLDPYTYNLMLGASREIALQNRLIQLQTVLRKICSSESEAIGRYLAPATVKYVIVDLSKNQNTGCEIQGTYVKGDPQGFLEILNRQKDLRLVAQTGEFQIYQNLAFFPQLSVWTQTDPQLASPPEVLTNQDNTALSGFELMSDKGNGGGFRIIKVKPTYYEIELETAYPALIVLSDSYHSSWEGHIKDGGELSHLKTFGWSNGFYIPDGGRHKVEIIFEKQSRYKNILILWGATWAGFGGLLLYFWQKQRRNKFKKEKGEK